MKVPWADSSGANFRQTPSFSSSTTVTSTLGHSVCNVSANCRNKVSKHHINISMSQINSMAFYSKHHITISMSQINSMTFYSKHHITKSMSQINSMAFYLVLRNNNKGFCIFKCSCTSMSKCKRVLSAPLFNSM